MTRYASHCATCDAVLDDDESACQQHPEGATYSRMVVDSLAVHEVDIGPTRTATEVLADPPRLFEADAAYCAKATDMPAPVGASCDSPELVAIRSWVEDDYVCHDTHSRGATRFLLRMVGELKTHLFNAGNVIAGYIRERDELRAEVDRLNADREALGRKNTAIKNNQRAAERERDELRAALGIVTASQQARIAELESYSQASAIKLDEADAELTHAAERLANALADVAQALADRRMIAERLAEAEKQVEISSQWAATYFDKTMAERKRAEAAEASVAELEAELAPWKRMAEETR
jgi:hypothetical protein